MDDLDHDEIDGNSYKIPLIVAMSLEHRIAVLSNNVSVPITRLYDYDNEPTDDLFRAAAFSCTHGDVQYIEYVEDFVDATRH